MLVSVRKMGDEQGEMFFPEYWRFDTVEEQESVLDSGLGEPPRNKIVHLDGRDNSEDWANASILQPLQAPFALHDNGDFDNRSLRGRFLESPRAIFGLDKRQFQCPGDTTACSNINQSNSCCPTGTVCQSITDTGSGAVGCCPEGSTCAEEVGACGAPDTSCPDSSGGGCCLQGYSCSGVGCVSSSTVTTTIEPVVTASPPPSSTSPATSASPIFSPIVSTSTFIDTTSVIATITASSSKDSPTSTPHSSTPSPNPSSTNPSPTPTPTSSALLPPLRPTSSATPLTITASQCPTGFYQCSAYLYPGCCQVGRSCALTSCPAASPSTILTSNGVTIAVPSGDPQPLGTSGCAGGWFACGSAGGGGCCPSGYSCGTSCTATAVVVQGGQTGTATVAKDNGVGRVGRGRGEIGVVLAFVVGVLLFWI
nr:hypothetical protein FAC7G5_23 [Penicillium fuscum]